MRHLFIINPISAKVKGKADSIAKDIDIFMSKHPRLKYDVHITRWCRDALCYCRRYVQNSASETVRIHALGGTGTHFEIVNAIVDLPNAQFACYPMGRANTFLRYFGLHNINLFASFEQQVFSGTIKVDAVRCNNNFGINNVLIGLESYVDNMTCRIMEKFELNHRLCYIFLIIKNILNNKFIRNYKVSLDGKILDGCYMSIAAANQPWYGRHICPGIGAQPNNGILNVHTIGIMKRYKRLLIMPFYLFGKNRGAQESVNRHSGKKLEISSNKPMWISIDGEIFFEIRAVCEIMPDAISFVHPKGLFGRDTHGC